jgi:hypothetical protein
MSTSIVAFPDKDIFYGDLVHWADISLFLGHIRVAILTVTQDTGFLKMKARKIYIDGAAN